MGGFLRGFAVVPPGELGDRLAVWFLFSLSKLRHSPSASLVSSDRALAEIQRVPEVADALFALLDVQATLKSSGKLTLASGDSTGLLLNS